MKKPTGKKSAVRKFRHDEIVGVVEDQFIVELVRSFYANQRVIWDEIGRRIGIPMYKETKKGFDPIGFAINSSGQVKYIGRTQK